MANFVRRALVIYNAAVAAAAQNQDPVLLVGQQQMAGFVHSPPARAVLALPGQDVTFVRGAITAAQIGQHRPSYVNAILIQSRGLQVHPACLQCRTGPGLRPFPECRRLRGHFGGCCANCKWRDHAARCTAVRRGGDDGGSEDDDDHHRRTRSPSAGAGSDVVVTGQRRLDGRRFGEQRLLEAGTAGNPIVL